MTTRQTTPKTELCGLIVIDQRASWIRVPAELLILDGRGWLSFIKERHETMAADGEDAGDDSFAAEMRGLARDIGEMLATDGYLEKDGMWPHIATRARFPIWGLNPDDPGETRRYVHFLLEFGHDLSSPPEEVEFVAVCTRHGLKVYVTPDLTVPLRWGLGLATALPHGELWVLARELL